MNSSFGTSTEQVPPTRWLFGPLGPLAYTSFEHPKPWLRLLISHGFSEHRRWWQATALRLRDAGVSVVCFDHYHHGLSAGRANDLSDIAVLAQGLKLALDTMQAEPGPKPPLVILGHSQGALGVLHFLHTYPGTDLAGVVLCAPLLGLNKRLASFGMFVARWLMVFLPRVLFSLKSDPSRLTHDESLWPEYNADPLRRSGLTPRYFRAMFKGIAKVRAQINTLPAPLLLLEAGEEVIVSSNAIAQWYAQVQTPEKTHLYYPGMRHELFNEVDKAQVEADLLHWAEVRFAGNDEDVTEDADTKETNLAQPQQSSPLRVLHLDLERGWRGGQQQAAYLIDQLQALGVQNHLACREGEALHKHAMAKGWAVTPLKGIGLAPGGGLWRLPAIIREHDIQIVHAHSSRAQNLGLLLRLRFPGIKLVVHRRVDFPRRRGILNAWKYKTALVERWIAISQGVRRVMEGDGVPSNRISLVHSGVDTKRFGTAPSDPELNALRKTLQEELGIPEGAFLVGNIGALVPHKDQHTLIRAFHTTRTDFPEAHLLIAGEGELRASLEGLIGELELQGAVHLLGQRNDLPLLAHLWGLYVMSSQEEGLGTSVLDAMSAGLPVVVTDAGGLPEMVTPERNGLVVPRRDPAALGHAMARMMADADLRARCSGQNLADVQAFSARVTAEKTLAVYHSLV